jgi:membrane-associated phospholipid phosphatase
MSSVIAAGRRHLPRGYKDLLRQAVIWCGFYFAYLGVRSLADRNPAKAGHDALWVINFEQRVLHGFVEQTAQRVVDSSNLLLKAAAYTYWNSEFTVIALTLLWVYLRRHERFARFRNTILVANTIGLVGYFLVPTAPPWMYPELGFVDGVNHASGALNALANPYAAMPSLHAADSLIVGVMLAQVVRNRFGKVLWLLWPVWVWFCVMATANHYLLDVVGGALVAVIALAIVTGLERRRAARGSTDAESAPIANLL